MPPNPTITVTAQATAEELAVIGQGLTSFNESEVGPAERLSLTVLVRDDARTILGGLSGYTAWGWLYVQWLWFDATLRNQGMAGRVLSAAEAEARQRGCHGSYIDTFNPQALRAYQRQGYIPFGELPNFPPGRTRTFLQKPL